MNNYQTVRLGDVCEIAAGQGAPQGESNYCDDGTPFVKAGNLIELINGKDEFEIQKVSEEVANSHKLKKYSAGSILFAKSGMSCMKGYVYQLKNDSYVVSHLAIVKPKEDSSDYIEYCLRHIKPNTLVKDEAYPSISLQDISNLQIPLPPLATQKHIAAVLDKCTALIAKHKLMLEKYDTLIKSQFVEMFGANQYPVMPVSNLCDFITKGTTPPTSEITEEYFEDAIPYFKVYNLSFNGELLFTEKTQYISRKIHETVLARSKVFPNDVLMNIVGPPLGKFSLIPKNYTESNINQAIAIFRAKEKVIPLYLLHALMFPDTLQPIINSAVGIRQQNLSLEQCRNLKIPVPPLALQEKFASFVQAVDAQKAKAQQSLDKAETLYKAMMQEFFG